MTMGAPAFLLLLWLVPAAVVTYIWGFRRRDQLLGLFAQQHLLAALIPATDRRRQWVKAWTVIAALALMIVGLAQPRWGFSWETLTRRGVDIMIAVDVSQSMKATDVEPNRLERAKRELVDLLGMLKGDRIGLIAFAGAAFVQCPLTLDYGAFRMFLDYLDPTLIPVQGTAIGDAITKATSAFDEKNPNSRALILITDGEDHQGDPLGAAKKAKEKGITVYTIGIGATEGAPIPNPDGSGFISDRSGNMVISRLDEDTLRRIALDTGGAYARSTTGDIDLETIYEDGIRQDIAAQDLTSGRQKRWEERFQWPLGLALLLLLTEGFVSDGRRASSRGEAA